MVVNSKQGVSAEVVENKIYLIRGKRVLFDRDLALLYDVSIKRLNEQVKRNIKRFPADFMFQLSKEEFNNLRSHFATSSWGGRRYSPYVFTEQGVAMLSSVLNSERAIQVNIAIMRVFVHIREMIVTQKDFSQKLKEIEAKIENHEVNIQTIFEAIRELMSPPPDDPKPKIGFHPVK
jgi:hypothetical protein